MVLKKGRKIIHTVSAREVLNLLHPAQMREIMASSIETNIDEGEKTAKRNNIELDRLKAIYKDLSGVEYGLLR